MSRSSSWPGIEVLIDIVKQTSNELIEPAERLDPEAEIDLPYLRDSCRYPIRFFSSTLPNMEWNIEPKPNSTWQAREWIHLTSTDGNTAPLPVTAKKFDRPGFVPPTWGIPAVRSISECQLPTYR